LGGLVLRDVCFGFLRAKHVLVCSFFLVT
jgi:hypothetical protein